MPHSEENMNTQAKGILIPIGGNEDKGQGDINEMYTQDFIHEGILSHVVEQSGGQGALIVVIPTASSIPEEVSQNYLSAFGKLGCRNVQVMDIRKKTDSNREDFLELAARADGILFSGGNQSKITRRIANTKLHTLLKKRYQEEEGFVIAGTSAGAMAMSQEMIAGGSNTESLYKGNVIMKKGLGFLPEAIIDTHFVRRGRFGRISEAIAKHPNLIGLGLAEDTGIIIRDGHHCTVIGSGMVIVFDGSGLSHNNTAILQEGTPMTIGNMKVHVMANSDQFDLRSRKLEVLGLDAPFI